ncbi:MAG: phosphoenolpyruvate synthase, partial [Thermomicrobiales bacterium]
MAAISHEDEGEQIPLDSLRRQAGDVDQQGIRSKSQEDAMSKFVQWFADLSRNDVSVAGGKGANLGEMTRAGLPVPPGFVVTADAFHEFIRQNQLDQNIVEKLAALDVDDHDALEEISQWIQTHVRESPMPEGVKTTIADAYGELCRREKIDLEFVAVRSSATQEDTKEASFAGMNRSFLNVRGEDELTRHVREVWASLYSPRVIFYRKHRGFTGEPAIAVIVQKMIDAEKSGVAFSIDPATGNPETIVIEAALGLGEVVVSGQAEPDHYEVAKADLRITRVRTGYQRFELIRNEAGDNARVDLPPHEADRRVLTDEEIIAVARLVLEDEAHYGTPQDTEWAFERGKLYLVQSRPVTTGGPGASVPSSGKSIARNELARGLAASPGIAAGKVRVLASADEGEQLEAGEILVGVMTTPDWVPYMRLAAAIVTDSGGMTSHAAIISRELGVPCIVGTRTATTDLKTGTTVTVDGALGVVYEGDLTRELAGAPQQPGAAVSGASQPAAPVTATRLMVNLAEPERAVEVSHMHVDGVGLLRAEFMLLSALEGTHPRKLIADGKGDSFVERMVSQLQIFADAFYPRPVIYRSTDFRTNEFRGLAGGEAFEPVEENPI